MTIRRLLIILVALAFPGASAATALAGPEIVPVHLHADAACDVAAWSYTACGHITNDALRVTGPGTVGPANLAYVASTGNDADLFDITQTIFGGQTLGMQAGHAFGNSSVGGSFFWELEDGGFTPVALAGIHIGVDFPNSERRTLNACIPQRWVWCERTAEYDSGRDTQADFRVSTRPLLIQIVNNTPNPIQRDPYGIATSGFLQQYAGLEIYRPIAPGGSAWLGGLRRRGDASCPNDPATGKAEAECVRTKLGHTSVGAYFRIQPQEGATPDYAGGELSFSVKARTDGAHTSRCTPMYRPTLPPLTCTVEFGGSNDGVLTAVVTLKAAGA